MGYHLETVSDCSGPVTWILDQETHRHDELQFGSLEPPEEGFATEDTTDVFPYRFDETNIQWHVTLHIYNVGREKYFQIRT
jgi:hypothetical protein